MAPKNKLIIDTDPGVDDVMALLLALSASPEELEVTMLSVTYGNVPLHSCLRNVVALFNVLDKEFAWRKSTGRVEGYGTMKATKPIVAIGPEHSLQDKVLKADDFHGADGLHNVHDTYPEFSPSGEWKAAFQENKDGTFDPTTHSAYFTPSCEPSHKEILRILRENPVDTVSIAALGPLTNVALAASEDPETLLRAKELVVMGGAVDVEGNVTPVAEFNCYADAVAAARVYALTSFRPNSTMPDISEEESVLPPYPAKLSRQLKLILCPLDITTPHLIPKSYFAERIKPLIDAGSPLAQWASHSMTGAFNKIESIEGISREAALSLHDPLTIWYMLTQDDPKWKLSARPEDIRVETSGQWTRGMHVADRRFKKEAGEANSATDEHAAEDEAHDASGWLSAHRGNRIHRVVASPGEEIFKDVLMKRVFGA